MNRADLKQRAKAQLGGSIFGSVWLYAVLVFFINALIQLVGGQIPLLGRVVGLLLTGPLELRHRQDAAQAEPGRPGHERCGDVRWLQG